MVMNFDKECVNESDQVEGVITLLITLASVMCRSLLSKRF